ncbi:MAG: M4 family metallopeptidase [Myxococcota bacterium]
MSTALWLSCMFAMAAGVRPHDGPLTLPTGQELARRLGNANATLHTDERGRLRAVHGELGGLAPADGSAVAFVRSRAGLLGLRPDEQLVVQAQERDAWGNTHVRLRRVVDGLAVELDEVRVHANARGRVVALEVEASDLGGDLPREAVVTPEQAVKLARRGATDVLSRDPRPTLVVVGGSAGLARAAVAYRVRLSWPRKGGLPYHRDVYVHAQTGAVLLELSRVYSAGTPATMGSTNLFGQSVTLNVAAYQNGVTLENTVTVGNNGVITTLDGSREYAFYLTPNTGTPFSDASAVTVHDHLKRVIDHYGNVFGWRNWDFNLSPTGAGGQVYSVVHEGQNLANAYWTTATLNGQEVGFMAFGDGDGQVLGNTARCLDVAAHEVGHGVVDGTAKLVYHLQSGALNEHLADVMGWLIDQEDDLMGEDCAGPQSQPALRDLCNPGNVVQPQPGHMSQFQDLPDTEQTDWGGVHVNSGIPNRAACLVRNALGADKVGRVWFQTLRYHLGPTSTFSDMVNGTATSCSEVQLSGEDCAQVAAAWTQVGLGTAATGGGCPANSTPVDGQCFCNEGYRPNAAGTGCELLSQGQCPPNSQPREGACYCNVGYVPNAAGSACVPESQAECPSNSHRENGGCVCNECYQGTPGGNGYGCQAIPGCVPCVDPLETGESGSCQCIAGISLVCGPQSMQYQYHDTNSGQTFYGEVCCRPDDPCGWGGDGYCDCFGECAFDAADCGSSNPQPLCRARNGGDCGQETWAGRCESDVLIFCDDRSQPQYPYVQYVHCPSFQAGYVCGPDTVNGGFNCVQQQSNCGDIPATGRCAGNLGRYCDSGVLRETDCGANGCGVFTYQGTWFEYCLPCPPNATLQGEQCFCNPGFVVSADGTRCDPSGGSGSGSTSSGGTSGGNNSSGGVFGSTSGGGGGGSTSASAGDATGTGSSSGGASDADPGCACASTPAFPPLTALVLPLIVLRRRSKSG